MTGFSSIPTDALRKMWEDERDAILRKADATVCDYDRLLSMRKELDRRSGEPKQLVDINFANDYLTD